MRIDRLSAKQNPIKDYLLALSRDRLRTPEDRKYLVSQATQLLREFVNGSHSELVRLRCALENLEVARDRSQPWEVRGPSLDRAARILQGLAVIPRRKRGQTVPAKSRRSADQFITPPSPLGQDSKLDDKDDQDDNVDGNESEVTNGAS